MLVNLDAATREQLVVEIWELRRQLAQVRALADSLSERLMMVKDQWRKLPESATGGIRAEQW